MTSSSNTTNGLNRRALIKGAAWSTPVIATAAAVPAYAASTDAQEPRPEVRCLHPGVQLEPLQRL